MFLLMLQLCAVRAGSQEDFTCVRRRYALGEHAVRDDVEHTERKHHRHDGEAELEHILHVGLPRKRDTEIKVKDSINFEATTATGWRASIHFWYTDISETPQAAPLNLPVDYLIYKLFIKQLQMFTNTSFKFIKTMQIM